MKSSTPRRPKIGIFFSHPNQHHTIMFRRLAEHRDLDVKVYYYDPGLMGRMFDPGYGTSHPWDVDLLSGTDSVVLRNPFRSKQVSAFRQLNPGVVSAMLREKFDAIYLLGYVAPSNWLVLALAKLLGAHVFYQSDANVLDERRKRRSALRTKVRDFFLRRVDTFLVIGNKNREAYVEQGLPSSRMTWCPCPVDQARFREVLGDPELQPKLQELRHKYGIPAEARVIVFCGKLIPRKRPEDLIAALRLVDRKDVYGLLIGSGELQKSLEQSLQPKDNMRITGFVNQSQIPYHMALGSIGIVCSDDDPHPLVTTEFALCGLPVLVSDHCGVWGDDDILRPGENGDTYSCGDVEELASKIRRFLDDDALRAQMGARSSELAETQSAEYGAEVLAEAVRAVAAKTR